MDDRQKMRASDADRQEVIERLRAALDEGRLTMDEYLERMGLASEAVTYGDLAPLYADLPESASPVARRDAGESVPAAPRAAGPALQGRFGRLPASLRAAWRVWLVAVSVNVVIWVLVSATNRQLTYPWPVWVAGPWGAVLLALSAGASRRTQPEPRRLPPGPD
jgi:hypothetical protein